MVSPGPPRDARSRASFRYYGARAPPGAGALRQRIAAPWTYLPGRRRTETRREEDAVRVLTEAQHHQLVEQGYLVLEHILDPITDLQPLLTEYDAVLDEIAASLQRAGLIRSCYRELAFCDRLIQVCVESGRNFPQHFDLSLPQAGIRYDTPIHVGPAVFGLLTHPFVLDVVEDVCGPEIYCNPVQHIR